MRHHLNSILPTILGLSTTFIVFKVLALISDSELPIVVVISESMAPAFHRGDLLFLCNRSPSIEVGDIPVMWFEEQKLPMVHRAVSSYWEPDETGLDVVQHILTKGDNNEVDDVALYPAGKKTVLRAEIKGVVRGYVPYLGWATILPKDLLQRIRGGWK